MVPLLLENEGKIEQDNEMIRLTFWIKGNDLFGGLVKATVVKG